MVNKQETKNEMKNKFWFQLTEMHATILLLLNPLNVFFLYRL